MSDPGSYAAPPVASTWEWMPGNPMGHEVVTVKEVQDGSVWMVGPSGDRIVSLADWIANAVPATLRHRR